MHLAFSAPQPQPTSATKPLISLSDIAEARNSLQGVLLQTEIRKLNWLDRLDGYEVYAKFEHCQPTGSFKLRGAYHRLRCQRHGSHVITASSGNHGFAVAAAGKMLGLETAICIPVTASPIKKERIAALGAAMIVQGGSLEEATAVAKQIAEQRRWDFISPYDDALVICGQATLGLELVEQLPKLDTIVVPVGGGGLIAGIAIAAKSWNPSIKVIGVQAANYPSLATSVMAGKVKRVPNQPTLADGLAVNLEPNSITLELVKNWVDQIVVVSEEEIAAATLALLYRESQLVEPSGAAGLAAILGGKLPTTSGITAVVLSGGNISTATLCKIINYPFKEKRLLKFVNSFGERASNKIIIRGISGHDLVCQTSAPVSLAADQKSEALHDLQFLRARYASVKQTLETHQKQLSDYLAYCKSEGLLPSTLALATINQLTEMLTRTLQTEERLLDTDNYQDIENHSTFMLARQQAYRAMLNLLVPIQQILDWRSASYSQSLDPQFFGVESQMNSGCNYNRYESTKITELENQTRRVIGVDSSRYCLFHTSSGMAAYGLIEAYLLRYALKPGDTILLCHYIYFETEEQITKLPFLKIERRNLFERKAIIAAIMTIRPRVVFIDPMTNDLRLRMTDVTGILQDLNNLPLEHDLYVVVDGTLVSGALRSLFELPLTSDKLHLMYYDSCSKYLQLGQDVTMAGVVVIPIEYQALFERLRRNSGTILYDMAACLFPRYQPEEHDYRMKRFTRNALFLAQFINQAPNLKDFVTANFPLLDQHPDVAIARLLPYIGGLITFSFPQGQPNHPDELNALIEIVVHTCKKRGVPITRGVSFGFSVPRISAASSPAEDTPAFLRLSVGDRSLEETSALGHALVEAFERYRRAKIQ